LHGPADPEQTDRGDARFVAAFLGSESFLRLIGSILIGTNEDWITGYRYLNMAEFLEKRSSDAELVVSMSPELPVVSITDL
jgi:hypothetical protein